MELGAGSAVVVAVRVVGAGTGGAALKKASSSVSKLAGGGTVAVS